MKKVLFGIFTLLMMLTLSVSAQASKNPLVFKNKDYKLTVNYPDSFTLISKEQNAQKNAFIVLFRQSSKASDKYNYVGIVVDKLDNKLDIDKLDSAKIQAYLEKNAKEMYPNSTNFTFSQKKFNNNTIYSIVYYEPTKKEDIVQAITFSKHYSYTFSMIAAFEEKEALDSFSTMLKSFKSK